MNHKRPFDAYNSPESSSPLRSLEAPPLKRRLVSSSIHGPFIFSSPSAAASTSTTPYSQRTHSCHVTPSDSPTNPFGRIRKLALIAETLTLPRATSFSKHLPLRMQVVHVGSGSDCARTAANPDAHTKHGEGTFRIVQVPLNYSFRHLKKLLDFLFTPDTSGKASYPSPRQSPCGKSIPVPISAIVPDLVAAIPKRTSPLKPRSAVETGKQRETEYAGHLFEVQDSVRMYRTGKVNPRPGHIRSARTWAKLSAVRDPFRSGRALDGLDFLEGEELLECRDDRSGKGLRPNDGGNEDEKDGEQAEDEEEEDEPIWEAEEDFTLAHVWPDGGEIHRGITYHHSPCIQIHITMNTAKIPGRKGIGNKPFVFKARGRGFNCLPGEEGWGDEDGEDFDWDEGEVTATRWNNHEAFDRYLVREGKREGAYAPPPDEDEDEEEEEVYDDKSDLMLPPHASSTYSVSSASSVSSAHSARSASSSPFPFLPATTPAPSTRLHRLRVEYAARRIERLNKKGIGQLVVEVSDAIDGEEDEEAEGVDELDRDDDGGEEVVRPRAVSTEV